MKRKRLVSVTTLLLAFLLSISSFSIAEGQEISDISEAPKPSAAEVSDEATPAEQPLEVLVAEAVETVAGTEESAGEAPEPSAAEVSDEATPAEQPLEVLVVEAVETVAGTEESAGEAPEPSAAEVSDEATPAEQPLEVLVVEAVETVAGTEESAGEAQPAEDAVAPQRSYTVTFRSGEQHSVIAGDAMTALSLILNELGEDGEVLNVTSSNDELFTAEMNSEGSWILVSKQPFETAETLSVELEGRSEPIVLNVTDPEEVLVDLSKGNVKITDSDDGSTEAKPTLLLSYTADDGTFATKNIANGSSIRVKQTGSDTTATSRNINILLEKAKSFLTLILDKLNISAQTGVTVDTEAAGSEVALELDGDSTIGNRSSYSAAVRKQGEGSLVIQDENDIAGSLTALSNYGAAIGGNQKESVKNISVTGGTVNATSGYGAAIGGGQADYESATLYIEDGTSLGYLSFDYTGGDACNIAITGGTVTATSNYGAAIGAGQSGNADGIRIGGDAVVTATGSRGAGIGGGQMNGGAGSGAKNITIGGIARVTASSSFGAGIGAGQGGDADGITIGGSAEVTAKSNFGAGIGAGQADKDYKTIVKDGDNPIKYVYRSGKKYLTSGFYEAGKKGGGAKNIIIRDRAVVDANGLVGIGATEKDSEYVNIPNVSLWKNIAVIEKRSHYSTEIVPEPPKEETEHGEETESEEETAAVIFTAANEKAESGANVEAKVDNNVVTLTFKDDSGAAIAPATLTIHSVSALTEKGISSVKAELAPELILQLDVSGVKNNGKADDITIEHVKDVVTIHCGKTVLLDIEVGALVEDKESETITILYTGAKLSFLDGDRVLFTVDISELHISGRKLTVKYVDGALRIYDGDKLLKTVSKLS